MSNSEESPHKERKVEASPSWPLLPLAPDDVTLNCLARVSRSDLGALSVASKSCRSLVASRDLYKMRSGMGRTETYVYVCLRTPPNPQRWYIHTPPICWYILRRRKSVDVSYDLTPIPSQPFQPPEASSVVVLDWEIYVIGGGSIEGKPTSDVFVLDCRTHKWRKVPSMRVARASAAAGVVDGKIYVFGGFMLNDYSSWGEVFDPKTQTWDSLPIRRELREYIYNSVVRDQKVYAVNDVDRTFYYSPREGKWGRGNQRGWFQKTSRDWCMIDNLLFSLSMDGTIYWYEPEELDCREPERLMLSKELKGLDSLKTSLSRSRLVHFDDQTLDMWNQNKIRFDTTTKLIDLLPGARLSNSGPNILLFWDVRKLFHLEIWCAEISLERRTQKGEIWGNILWSNAVMTIDPALDNYMLLHSVSVTL